MQQKDEQTSLVGDPDASIFEDSQVPEDENTASLDGDFEKEATYFRTADGQMHEITGDTVPAYLKDGAEPGTEPQVSEKKGRGRKKAAAATETPADTSASPGEAGSATKQHHSPGTATGVTPTPKPERTPVGAPKSIFKTEEEKAAQLHTSNGDMALARITEGLSQVISATRDHTLGMIADNVSKASVEELVDLDLISRGAEQIAFRSTCLVRWELLRRAAAFASSEAILANGIVDEERQVRLIGFHGKEIATALGIGPRTLWEDAQIHETFFAWTFTPFTDFYGNAITKAMIESAAEILGGKTFFLKALLAKFDAAKAASGDATALKCNPLAAIVMFADAKQANASFSTYDAARYAKYMVLGYDPNNLPEEVANQLGSDDQKDGDSVDVPTEKPADTRTKPGIVADPNAISPDLAMLLNTLFEAGKTAKAKGETKYVRRDSTGQWKWFRIAGKPAPKTYIEWVVTPDDVYPNSILPA